MNMKSGKTSTRVIVEYPSSRYPKYDKLIERIMGACTGSGMGFGVRDMTFDYPNKTQARRVIGELHKLRLGGISVKEERGVR